MRLDSYLVEIGKFDSRTKAKQAIERGEIFIDGLKKDKPSFEVPLNFCGEIEHVYQSNFVSLGGYKLEKALKEFNFSVKGLCVADIGASTGGFTDCLLQNGAAKVYAVDLNDDLLHEKLKADKRVVSVIKNARELSTDDFNDKLDLIVADLSFISATYVLDVFSGLIEIGCHVILLVKPQFEAGEKKKFKNGIIKDSKIHNAVLDKITLAAKDCNLIKLALATAPIVEGKNTEFLILFKKIV